MAGYSAFQQKYMGVDLLDDTEFTDFEARKMRYAVMWAMYENSVYSKIHRFSKAYKSEYGLYRFTRNIYNPSYRIGEFWKSHLLGGKLDPDAGDGNEIPSALPIITDNEALRAAIAQVWQWSNWQINKDVQSLWTSVQGDGVIKVVDDPIGERVYLKNVSPSTLKDITLDERGNVKGYVIEERRSDPRNGRGATRVTYREVATRDGDNVVYQTYLNEHLFAWDGDIAEWKVPYGFVPMVVLQHNNVGLDFGWSELFPGLSKFREADDLASKLSDQVRKMVDAPWLLAGVQKPVKQPKTEGEKPTPDNPEPGREEVPMLYGPVGANATPLIAPLSISETSGYIKEILADIERDYPELNADMHNMQGEISGRALRINRGPAEDKVLQRRPNYDDALMRAQQMAVSIGGMRNYDAFSVFNLDSYNSGALDHQIGERPVFSKDPMDDMERDAQFWTVAQQAKTFGIPPLVYLKSKGWTDEQLSEVKNSAEYKAHQAALDAATEAAKNPTTPATNRFNTNKNVQ